jgi:soluble epoxide hydrolase / lipid-phosphate phosphatase
MPEIRLMNFHRAGRIKVEVPCMFIQATRDNVLKPEMAAGMERLVPNLVRKEVVASHWALWERPAEVNQHIKDWFEQVVFARRSNL